MKTVINALPYKNNSSGIGVMIRELFGAYAAASELPCQVLLPGDAPEFPAGERTELVRIPWKHGQGLRRIFFQSFMMGRRFCRDAVLLTTDSKVPFFLPKSCAPVTLVTDLALYRMPEVYKLSRVLLWRLQYRYLRRRADRYLTVSEFTRREMTAILGIPPEKISVVPCACSENMARVEDPEALAAVREKYGLGPAYILFVGNNNPRKNLERIIRAFDLLKEESGCPHELVIGGEQGWKFDREKALAGIRHREDIRFIGFVADEDMAALYTGASVFAFPTLYEGFGIPVLEAQRCGTPVVTSGCSALPEVAGESAVLVDPYDTADICRGLRRVLEEPGLAETLVSRGRENAARFSWAASAGRLKELLEEEQQR